MVSVALLICQEQYALVIGLRPLTAITYKNILRILNHLALIVHLVVKAYRKGFFAAIVALHRHEALHQAIQNLFLTLLVRRRIANIL